MKFIEGLLLLCVLPAVTHAEAASIESTAGGGVAINVATGASLSVVQDGVASSLSDLPQKLDTETRTRKADDEETTKTLSAVSEAMLQLARSMKDGGGAVGPNTNTVVAVTADCSGSAGECNIAAASSGSITSFLRGAQGFDGSGIYTCRFAYTVETITAMDDNCAQSCDADRITSFDVAGLSKVLSGTTTSVVCGTPAIPPSEVPAAEWGMSLAILEGITELGGGPHAIAFQTAGPVFGPIPQITTVSSSDLTMDDGSINSFIFRFAVSDFDSDPKDIDVTATSSNTAVVAPGGVTLGDNNQGKYILQLTPTSAELACSTDEPDCTFVTTTITLTAVDNHKREAKTSFALQIDLKSPRMIFRLDTGDGDDRHYADNSFWESTDVYNEDKASEPGEFDAMTTGDIKTDYYSRVPVGEWVRIDAYDQDHNTEGASVWYKVLPEYQSVTFRDLVSSAQYQNTVFTESRISIKGSAPGIDDPFFDWDSPLKSQIQETEFNGGKTIIRLGTSKGKIYSSMHSFSGMGILHKEGDWCYDIEAAVNTGYCTTSTIVYSKNKNGFAQNYAYSDSKWGGCGNLPTTHNGDGSGCAPPGLWRRPRFAFFINANQPE